MESALIHQLLECGFIDERTLVEEGVSVVVGAVKIGGVFVEAGTVEIGGIPRWVVKRYRSSTTGAEAAFERVRTAYTLRKVSPTLVEVMPPLVGRIGNDTLLVAAVRGRSMWQGGSPGVAAHVIGSIHSETRGGDTGPSALPWILHWMDTDTSSDVWKTHAETLDVIWSRPTTVSALRELRATWRPIVFIHGDAMLHNAIEAADGRLRLLNWELSGRGDPIWDIAGLCLRPLIERAWRNSEVHSWWAQIVEEVARCALTHAKAYGQTADSLALVGMLGAWVLQAAAVVALGQGAAEGVTATVVTGYKLLESAELYATALDNAMAGSAISTLDLAGPSRRGL